MRRRFPVAPEWDRAGAEHAGEDRPPHKSDDDAKGTASSPTESQLSSRPDVCFMTAALAAEPRLCRANHMGDSTRHFFLPQHFTRIFRLSRRIRYLNFLAKLRQTRRRPG